MNKRVLATLALVLMSGTFLVKAVTRTYDVPGVFVHCKDYNEVYDARGNLKDPNWYVKFEDNMLTDRNFLRNLFGQNVRAEVGALVGRPTKISDEDYLKLISGVKTVQFSHQFITRRVRPELLAKMNVPVKRKGSIVQVCRVYYYMEPVQPTVPTPEPKPAQQEVEEPTF